MESLNLQVVAVLMPLEIKRHTVPHLKALTRSIERRGGHGHGSTFKQRYTVMKSTILLRKWPKRRFQVTVAVCNGTQALGGQNHYFPNNCSKYWLDICPLPTLVPTGLLDNQMLAFPPNFSSAFMSFMRRRTECLLKCNRGNAGL